MDPEKLVENYISAWNRKDVDGLLALMHDGVAFYDAFWMECCVGRDAVEYLRNSLDEDEYRFQLVGDVMAIDDCVSFRYAAYEAADSNFARILFNGAEVLNVRDNKIMTVSDFYCDSDKNALEEVSRLVAQRHGLPKYAESGLSAHKASRYRNQLSALIDHDRVHLDPDLTLSQLSNQVGCSLDHMSRVINAEFGTDFHVFVNECRVKFARELLLENPGDPDHLLRVAKQSGFRSFEEFNNSFDEVFGETPAKFVRRSANEFESGGNPSLQ